MTKEQEIQREAARLAAINVNASAERIVKERAAWARLVKAVRRVGGPETVDAFASPAEWWQREYEVAAQTLRDLGVDVDALLVDDVRRWVEGDGSHNRIPGRWYYVDADNRVLAEVYPRGHTGYGWEAGALSGKVDYMTSDAANRANAMNHAEMALRK